MYIRGLSINWNAVSADSYLREIDAIRGLEDLQFRKPITFFVGENGSGKSTLLEAIAIAYGFNPEGGTRNYHFSTRDTHSELCDAIRLIRNPSRPGWGYFLRAESFYNVATAEEGYAEVSRDYHNPTGKVFWPSRRTTSAETACICWMSRRPLCRRRDS